MKNGGHDVFISFEEDPENIDFYISRFVEFNEFLKAIYHKAPETRAALLDAKHIDVIYLRTLVLHCSDILKAIEDGNTLEATGAEASAAYQTNGSGTRRSRS